MIRKIKLPIVILIFLGMTFYSIGQEAQATLKINVDAWLHAVKIVYKNQDITGQLSPVVIKGTTYLPVGNSANFFNKDISWNALNKTITITDRSIDLQYMEQEKKISELQNIIGRLEGQLESVNIETLELELNDTYDEYRDVLLKFTLTGDEDSITVKIKADKEDWNDNFTNSQEEKFISKVCRYIHRHLNDVDIEGSVKDGSKSILEFSAKSEGSIKIGNIDINDLEDILNEKLYDNDFGRLRNISNRNLDIDVKGNDDEFSFYIEIDLDDYKSQWNRLDEEDIEDFIYEIYEYIRDKETFFEDSEITGYFYDTHKNKRLVKCYESNNRLRFIHY